MNIFYTERHGLYNMSILIFYSTIFLILFTGGGMFGLTSNDISFIIRNKVSYNGGMKVIDVALEVRPDETVITREVYIRANNVRETESRVLKDNEVSYDEIKKLFASMNFTDRPVEKGASSEPVKREVESSYSFFINGQQKYPDQSTVHSKSYKRLFELFHKYENI